MENGRRQFAEAVGGKVLGHGGREELRPFDGAAHIDADGENHDDHGQDGDAHVGRCPAYQAGTKDGQEEDDGADDADAGRLVARFVGARGGVAAVRGRRLLARLLLGARLGELVGRRLLRGVGIGGSARCAQRLLDEMR